jgi:hypothetical protein
MFGKKKIICAFINKPCIREQCAHWTNVKGVDPNDVSGRIIDDWKCAFAHMPLLFVEVARQIRSFAAAAESHRNEAAKSTQEVGSFLNAFAQMVNNISKDIKRFTALPNCKPEQEQLDGPK